MIDGLKPRLLGGLYQVRCLIWETAQFKSGTSKPVFNKWAERALVKIISLIIGLCSKRRLCTFRELKKKESIKFLGLAFKYLQMLQNLTRTTSPSLTTTGITKHQEFKITPCLLQDPLHLLSYWSNVIPGVYLDASLQYPQKCYHGTILNNCSINPTMQTQCIDSRLHSKDPKSPDNEQSAILI